MNESSSSFFTSSTPPSDLEEMETRVNGFMKRESADPGPIVLVTSGGTNVPLERRPVRFIDNFSQGTRGASCSEFFVRNGYRVLLLHREGTCLPFHRHLHLGADARDQSAAGPLDLLQVLPDGRLSVVEAEEGRLKALLNEYEHYKRRMMFISYNTLTEYMFYLRAICLQLKRFSEQQECEGINSSLKANNFDAIVFLAAAVSDFYVPDSLLANHKIQSSTNEGGLKLELKAVPKMLNLLIKEWVSKNTFVVTFKLETDSTLLIDKAKAALNKYGHHLVIANLLHNRKLRVLLVTPNDITTIEKGPDECEIEESIIPAVIEQYERFRRKEEQYYSHELCTKNSSESRMSSTS